MVLLPLRFVRSTSQARGIPIANDVAVAIAVKPSVLRSAWLARSSVKTFP